MEAKGPYVILTEEFWLKHRDKIKKLNSDLIPEMDEAAKVIEIDNHHNALMCPYCNPGR